MKKVACLVGISALLLSGCVFTGGNAIVGALSTDVGGPVHGGIHLAEVDENMVEGRAMASGILGIVSGDCSYAAALKDAFSKTDATKLKNIVVDYRTKNIFYIFAEYTTIVRGVPVQ